MRPWATRRRKQSDASDGTIPSSASSGRCSTLLRLFRPRTLLHQILYLEAMTNDRGWRTGKSEENRAGIESRISLLDLLTWLGESKRLVAGVTAAAGAASLAYALTLPLTYGARTSLLPPGSLPRSDTAAVFAALGSIEGIAAKTPDALYVALLRSDTVLLALDKRFDLKAHYQINTTEALRKALPQLIRVSNDEKAGIINIEVEDADPRFAVDLANAQAREVSSLLAGLALKEARPRRAFFEVQLSKTKEALRGAELELRRVQESSGLILADKQPEGLIGDAAKIGALIVEREVQLKVARTTATDQNRDVIALRSELEALRIEQGRLETAQRSATDDMSMRMPIGKVPEAAMALTRARRDVRLQVELLEALTWQFEMASLDESKDGPAIQQIDIARPDDGWSGPPRISIVAGGTLLGLLGSMAWIAIRRCAALDRARHPAGPDAWRSMKDAWRLRG